MNTFLQMFAFSEDAGGLFDFNGTLPLMALQLILLTTALTFLFYKPIANILETRETFINGNLANASEKLLKANELLLVDGCHSNASAKNLATHLKKYNNKVYGIWGIQKNRNPKEFLENFKGIYSKIVAIRIPDEPAACNPSELKRIANMMKIECEVAANIISALKMLSSKEKKVITFFGSLYLAGKVLDIN